MACVEISREARSHRPRPGKEGPDLSLKPSHYDRLEGKYAFEIQIFETSSLLYLLVRGWLEPEYKTQTPVIAKASKRKQ